MARHGGGPVGSAARDATASPYIGKRRAIPLGYDQDGNPVPIPLGFGAFIESVTYDDPPDDPPRCTSCGHLEADECGCTCCTWTCDERPANV